MGEQSGFDLLARKRKAALDRGSGGQNESKDTDSKLTATERIMRLVDTHSFVETQALAEYSAAADGLKQVSEPGEGVVTGFGTIDGRGVYVFSQDYTVLGGSVGYMHARKIIKLLDMAGKTGLPVIGLLDSMGARIGEGSAVMESFGKIIAKLSELSGVVPVITAICGQCSGTAAYFAPLSDFVFMTENISGIYTAAPGAYNKPGQPADTQTAGGAAMHARQTGLAHFLCPNENDLFCYIRQILSYLPDNNLSEAPVFECADDLNRRLEDFRKPYDMRDVVSSVLDGGDFFESQACYAPAVITGFGRINGKSIGVIANSSGLHINGESCSKAAGFISFCDAFGIPIVTFSDTPGFEKNAFNIKSGANLMRAYSEATVPLVTVITGDAIGAGYIAMASKALGADMVFAWPDAVISCLPADAASIIVLSDAFPETDSPSDARKQAAERYAKTFASPWEAAKLGYVDEVIYPSETRQRVAGALEFAAGKRESKLPKKHGTRLY